MTRRAATSGSALAKLLLLSQLLLLGTGAVAAHAELPPITRVEALHLDDLRVDEEAEYPVQIVLRAESAKGQAITDLRRVDLSVNQDGVPLSKDAVRLEKLGATESKLRCVIVLDASRVMRGAPFEAAREAALRLADALQATSNEVAVVVFGGEARVLSPFSDAPEEQRVRLEQLENAGGSLSTALYDGIAEGLSLIDGPSDARARFVVLFSDGVDNGSVDDLDDVLALATVGEEDPQVPIFSVGYSRVGGRFDALRDLARASHGAVLPARSVDDIDGAFQNALARVRGAYLLSLDPSLDGQSHEISVAVEETHAARRVTYPEGSALSWWVVGGLAAALVLGVGVLVAIVVRRRLSTGGRLVFADGPRAGQEVAIRSDRFRIGALDDNDIVLDDETVSRHHAELRRRGSDFEIADLSSTNGTLVNGQRILQPQRLRPGDRIGIASQTLVLRQ